MLSTDPSNTYRNSITIHPKDTEITDRFLKYRDRKNVLALASFVGGDNFESRLLLDPLDFFCPTNYKQINFLVIGYGEKNQELVRDMKGFFSSKLYQSLTCNGREFEVRDPDDYPDCCFDLVTIDRNQDKRFSFVPKQNIIGRIFIPRSYIFMRIMTSEKFVRLQEKEKARY